MPRMNFRTVGGDVLSVEVAEGVCGHPLYSAIEGLASVCLDPEVFGGSVLWSELVPLLKQRDPKVEAVLSRLCGLGFRVVDPGGRVDNTMAFPWDGVGRQLDVRIPIARPVEVS